jgi:hypothetical protein
MASCENSCHAASLGFRHDSAGLPTPDTHLVLHRPCLMLPARKQRLAVWREGGAWGCGWVPDGHEERKCLHFHSQACPDSSKC